MEGEGFTPLAAGVYILSFWGTIHHFLRFSFAALAVPAKSAPDCARNAVQRRATARRDWQPDGDASRTYTRKSPYAQARPSAAEIMRLSPARPIVPERFTVKREANKPKTKQTEKKP